MTVASPNVVWSQGEGDAYNLFSFLRVTLAEIIAFGSSRQPHYGSGSGGRHPMPWLLAKDTLTFGPSSSAPLSTQDTPGASTRIHLVWVPMDLVVCQDQIGPERAAF